MKEKEVREKEVKEKKIKEKKVKDKKVKDKKVKKGGFKFDFNKMLLMFALIPLVCSVVIISIILSSTSAKEVKQVTFNSMLSLVDDTGLGMDNYFEEGNTTLKSFIAAPIVTEFLKNPGDATLAEEAQKYTVDFFNSLDGWEGIYIADWNSKVLTHPAPPVIGKVMREGDRLTELQNAMLNADDVYNVGIITSPASGELIISMYVPVYDGTTPIGYVGAGTFVKDTAMKYSDVSKLGLSTAYTYLVDKNGIMISHPNEEKIGNPVENAVVTDLVAKMQAGEHPEAACVEYEYKGAMKYAAYYVGVNENYIAVLTADEADVLANVSALRNVVIAVAIVLILIFTVVALVFARVVVKPLKAVVKAMKDTADGNLNVDTNIRSITAETNELIDSAKTLQGVLQKILGETKEISEGLNVGAQTVTNLSNTGLDRTAQIANAMEELADGATTMAESVQSINEKILIMGSAIEDITGNADELTVSSNKIKVANSDAANYIGKVSDSSEKSVTAVQDISKQISETNEAIDRIKSASDMIAEIASQTNLLALNASIEAARAGEAGRGFAVVATEIKNLSEQSNASAEDIQSIVREIVEKSERSVALSDEVAAIITEEQKFISETQNKFEVLNREIEVSLGQISNIGSKVDTLNASKETIVSAVSDLSAISEENAASNEEVSASVHEITGAVEDIATNAEETMNQAEQLQKTINYFN